MSKGIGGHHRAYEGRTDVWLTPPEILAALGEFDLDPCSPVDRPWPTAKQHYTEIDDGLKQEWFGKVFCNPPYGPETAIWMKKLADHGNGIALIFARTETKMFFESVWDRADAVLFIEGRLYFHYPNGERGKTNAGAPSVLIAYGKNNAEILKNCGIKGKYIDLRLH